jgi:hypothetical protein
MFVRPLGQARSRVGDEQVRRVMRKRPAAFQPFSYPRAADFLGRQRVTCPKLSPMSVLLLSPRKGRASCKKTLAYVSPCYLALRPLSRSASRLPPGFGGTRTTRGLVTPSKYRIKSSPSRRIRTAHKALRPGCSPPAPTIIRKMHLTEVCSAFPAAHACPVPCRHRRRNRPAQ